MYPIKEQDYRERNAEYLLQQWRDKPAIRALMDVYGVQFNNIETEFYTLLESLNIDLAQGYALDIIGKEVGEGRQSRADEPYRQALIVKIYINVSSGTPKEVTRATKLVTGATEVIYSEAYPAGVVLEIIGAEYVSKAPIIKKTLPAAIDLIFQKNIVMDVTQTYVGVAHSYTKHFESNVVYLDVVENGTMKSQGFLTKKTRLFKP